MASTMTRRGLFARMAALLTVPFAAKAKPAVLHRAFFQMGLTPFDRAEFRVPIFRQRSPKRSLWMDLIEAEKFPKNAGSTRRSVNG